MEHQIIHPKVQKIKPGSVEAFFPAQKRISKISSVDPPALLGDHNAPTSTSEGDIQHDNKNLENNQTRPLRGSHEKGDSDISLSESVIGNAYIAPEIATTTTQVYHKSVVHHHHYYNQAATSVKFQQSTPRSEEVGSGTDVSEKVDGVSGSVDGPGHRDVGHAAFTLASASTDCALPSQHLQQPQCEQIGSQATKRPGHQDTNHAPTSSSGPGHQDTSHAPSSSSGHQDTRHAPTLVGSDALFYTQQLVPERCVNPNLPSQHSPQPVSQSGQVGSLTVDGASTHIQQASRGREHVGSGTASGQDEVCNLVSESSGALTRIQQASRDRVHAGSGTASGQDEVCNLISVSSAKPGEEGCVEVKNLIFYHQSKLLLQALFWIGEEYGGDIDKVKEVYKSEGCLHQPYAALRMNAKRSGIIKVRFVSANPGQYDIPDANLKPFVLVSDLEDHKIQVRSFRVTPAPDRVEEKYLDIDYYVKIVGCEEQLATTRIEKKLEKDADIDNLMNIFAKLKNAGIPVNIQVGEPLSIRAPVDDARGATATT